MWANQLIGKIYKLIKLVKKKEKVLLLVIEILISNSKFMKSVNCLLVEIVVMSHQSFFSF
jgi:hypothetical protein